MYSKYIYIYTYDLQGAERNNPGKLAVELLDFYYVYHYWNVNVCLLIKLFEFEFEFEFKYSLVTKVSIRHKTV